MLALARYTLWQRSFNATFRSTSTPPGFPVPFTRRPSTEFWTPGPHSPLLTSTPLRGHLDGRGQWPACGMDVTVPLEQPAPAAAGRGPVTDSCPVQGSHTNRQAPLGPPPTSDRRGEADSLSAMSSTRGAQGDPPQRRPAPSPPRSNPHSVRRCHRHHYITSPSSRTAGGVRTCQAAHNTTGSSGTRRRHSRHHRRSEGPLRGEECGRAPRSFLHKPLDGASASVSTLASDKRGVASKIKRQGATGEGIFFREMLALARYTLWQRRASRMHLHFNSNLYYKNDRPLNRDEHLKVKELE
ncbi:uncharacterized protein LOC135372362 [Ornithodoros turicata]|uniref:uncharacterized protein LOC135372362 n=1 Tax=Ornithodoros turicata TaxID=34597 RepID=UPI00313863AE